MYETITPNIMVKNVRDTINFYQEKLGFQVTLTVPEEGDKLDFAIVTKDKISIMFQEQESLTSEYPTLKTNEIKPTFTLFITVQDVEKLYHELEDQVQIAQELHQTFYGRKEFAIFDLDGNILTIAL